MRLIPKRVQSKRGDDHRSSRPFDKTPARNAGRDVGLNFIRRIFRIGIHCIGVLGCCRVVVTGVIEMRRSQGA